MLLATYFMGLCDGLLWFYSGISVWIFRIGQELGKSNILSGTTGVR